VARRKRPLASGNVPSTEDELKAMRLRIRGECGDRPGVYRMIAEDGEVLYVGKSKRLRTRLLSYFRCDREEKGSKILREARRIEWDYTPSEFAALLTELRHIKRWRPRFNVAMKRDARNFCFIKLTKGPAPKLLVVRGAGSEDGGSYYGPFMGATRVLEAVREVNDLLGLRDCGQDTRMHFADQPELFQLAPRTPGCIRFEVRKCLGPCVAACSEREYAERVSMARGFLDGSDAAPMERLRAEMLECSERLEYERAGRLRDKLARLEGLREQFIRFRFAVETLSFLYTVPGHEGEDRVYLVRRGRVRAEEAAPGGTVDRSRLAGLVEEVFAPAERETAEVPTHEIDELLLLSSWFRRFPAELARTERADGLLARTA
jgi:excinuclease ABC subunit C